MTYKIYTIKINVVAQIIGAYTKLKLQLTVILIGFGCILDRWSYYWKLAASDKCCLISGGKTPNGRMRAHQ
jgi:hypothetical protein